MIVIAAETLRAIGEAAESAYPEECCGLLVGRRRGSLTRVTKAHAASNVATTARRRRFEIDPAARFALARALRGGSDVVVGHYHSHPDHPCEPSPRDVASAFEPDLVWLITAVAAGRATQTAAFKINGQEVTRLDLVVVRDRGRDRGNT